MRDSFKYLACFRVINFASVPWFSVDHFSTCSCVILRSTNRGRQTAKGVRGSIRKAMVLDESCKKKV